MKLKADLSSIAADVKTSYDAGADTETLWCTCKEVIKSAVDKHVKSKRAASGHIFIGPIPASGNC